MKLMKKKCQLKCGNNLPKEPFKVIIRDENGNNEDPLHICEECAKLIEVLGNKMLEMLDDESI
jgi:hypothetical protein